MLVSNGKSDMSLCLSILTVGIGMATTRPIRSNLIQVRRLIPPRSVSSQELHVNICCALTTTDNTWDPNWRGFIGTTFILILEEFSPLLSQSLQDSMLQSLHLDARGDTYRVGGVDDDNLYPEYSNAAIMHATVSGWVGLRTGDVNLTAYGEKWAREIVALFDRNHTLAEFNGPTYAGVSLFGLTLWAKYFPANTTFGANGGRMIREVWDYTTELYNANLKNVAGPWDRSYGFDQNRCHTPLLPKA